MELTVNNPNLFNTTLISTYAARGQEKQVRVSDQVDYKMEDPHISQEITTGQNKVLICRLLRFVKKKNSQENNGNIS